MSDPAYIAVAKLMGAHGIHGELRLMPYNPDSVLFEAGRALYLEEDGGYRPFEILGVRDGRQGLLLRLEGVNTPEAAKTLYGRELFFPSRELERGADPFENYVFDLLGLAVVDAVSGRRYGVVADLITSTGQNLFVVRDEQGVEALVPAVRPIIERFDMETKTVYVSLPEGLWELYHEG